MNYTYQMSESKDKIDEQELLANQNFWNNVGGLSVVLEMPDRMVGVYRMISGEFFDKKGNSMCRVDFATNEEFHSESGVIKHLAEYYHLLEDEIEVDMESR